MIGEWKNLIISEKLHWSNCHQANIPDWIDKHNLKNCPVVSKQLVSAFQSLTIKCISNWSFSWGRHARLVISLTVKTKYLWITLTAQYLTSYHVSFCLFILVAYCLSFLNGCVNPIALYFLSKSFKTHYINQLCCGRRTPTRPARQSSQPMIRFGNSRTSRHEATDQTEVSGPELSKLEPWSTWPKYIV